MLRDYAAFLKRDHLPTLADEISRLSSALDIPLMQLFRHLTAEQLSALNLESTRALLEGFETGTALERASQSLAAWENDELPGIPKAAIQPSDLVLVYAAQKQALLEFLPRFTDSVATAVAIAKELETYFQEVQEAAFKLFARLQQEAVEKAARAQAEREMAEAAARALETANERLASQSEELQAQQEELQDVYERLKRHNEDIESQVASRTDELAAANQELARNNLELQSLDALKDEFISIVSHELRTPVNAITGFGSILADGVVGDLEPIQQMYVQKMLAGADRLLALINDLLDYSRIKAGKFSLSREPLDARNVVKDSIAILADQATLKGITIDYTDPPEALTVLADAQRLGQILMNLLGNAIKFTPKGGAITIRLSTADQAVRFEVEDNGPGIAPDDMPRLFKRFGQLDTGPTRTSTGTGLGLAIVKSLVDAHEGEVGVESQPRKGSRFWFTLPVLAENPAD